MQTWAEADRLPDLECNFNFYKEVTPALYKAFVEAGVSEQSATRASEDVIQVSQLEHLATKADLMATESKLRSELATKASLAAVKAELLAKIDLMATKADLVNLENKVMAAMAKQETRLIKWMVGSLFVFASIIIAGGGILFKIMLSGVVQ